MKGPLVITGFTILSLFLLLLITSKLIFLNSYVDLEEREVEQNLHRVINSFTNEVSQMNTVAGDYAGWDESYRFIQDANTSFIKTNLADAIFPKLRLDMILFVTNSGKIIYEKGVDPKSDRIKPVLNSLHSLISETSPLVRHTSPESVLSGVLSLPEGQLLVVSRPILTSEYKGPIRGALIMARYLDSREFGRVTEITGLSTQFYRYNEPHLPAEIQSVRTALNRSNRVQIRPLSPDKVAGYSLINDIYGKPAFILKVETPRNVYKQGVTTIRYYIFALMGICLLSALIGYLLYSKLALSRRKQHESEARYHALIKTASDGILLVDAASKRIIEANDSFRNLVGYSGDELQGVSISSISELDNHTDPMFLSGHCSMGEQRYRCKDGGLVDVEVSANSIAGAESTILCVFVRDITERKQVEQDLRESEQNIKTLMEIMPVGVCWSDKDGKIEYVNQHFVELFGYTLAEIPSVQEWFMCAYPDQTYRESVLAMRNEVVTDALAKDMPVPPIETNVTCKDGSIRRIIINTQFARNRTLVIYTDITEHELLQNELLKTQKLESLGVLAGGIAHDFNNILTVISGNIALAQKFLDASHKSHKLLVEAEKASNRAAELAYQLLTFAKGGEPVKKVVSVRNLAHESILLALRGSNVQGVVEIPDSINAIEADDGQISQTFNNIIINAEQSMPDGGTLTVCAENIVLGEKNRPGLSPGDYVKISFADKGCGISDEDQKKIFDPYFTTKTGGTGLGLTSAYSIISKHHGYIEVNSVVGKGTTLTIYIPSIGKPFPETSTTTETAISVNPGGGSILVMDDEEMLRVFFMEMLTYLGYEVTTCNNGEEAIMLYKAASLSNRPFNAVIMDLTIPGGMGGKEAAQNILAFDAAASLIVSSGYSNDPVMAEYKNYGFRAAVAKPCRPDEIARVLSAF